MSRPTLCMIFEAIDASSAIAKVAMAGVQVALDAGYQVAVVTKQLDQSLRSDVEWLKLRKFSRGFALQWLTGRPFIRHAFGSRQFDIVHGHQPQIADLCDVFQCHFLTRVAYERRCLECGKSLRSRVVRAQQQVVLHAEDHFYRRWNQRTRMLFVGALVQREFCRLYSVPSRQEVLSNPCLPARVPTHLERNTARQELTGAWPGTVIGFLGGVQERKGFTRLVDGMREDRSLFLLLGGQFTNHQMIAGLEGRSRGLGLVENLDQFYAACDIVAVPSVFDPCPLVVLEAATRGIPTIVASGVGSEAEVVERGAGLSWGDSSLSAVVAHINSRYPDFQHGAHKMTAENSTTHWTQRLRQVYEDVLADRVAGRHEREHQPV